MCFIAEILEKHDLSHVSSYLNSRNLSNSCQTAYRPGHISEAALLIVVIDLFISHVKGDISVLAILYFSSVIDKIYYPILVHRIH